MMNAFEVNFDGLVGPTHNYAGLSHGNIASMRHGGAVSNPRAAALQGLAKMKLLADLGLPQAILPPHERPFIPALRELGFTGSDAEILATTAQRAPALLAACSSASAMWVANAATVAPSADSVDGRVHFTPANLTSKLHRSIEPPQTARTLRAIFRDRRRFVVHDPLPAGPAMGDEGAANHTRFAPEHGDRGLHFFVHGGAALGPEGKSAGPRKFAARQSLEASAAVARRHLLADEQVIFAGQSPPAIDAGVFHNDVISVGNGNVLLYHERAFEDTEGVVASVRRQFIQLHPGREFMALRVPARRVPLRTAVQSYLFNSQLVSVAPGKMALIAPSECAEEPRVRDWLRELVEDGASPVRQLHFTDLRHSMRNGGGPACLRLRVVLTKAELAAIAPGVLFDETLHRRLTAWVKRHYRDKLGAHDLADPHLLEESRRALDELTGMLGLGSIYPFQAG